MVRVGLAYDNGDGVEQNLESAFEWFLKTAEAAPYSTPSHVLHILGFFYEYGEGVDADLDQAMNYYQKSAAQGYQGAADAVARIS